jgi:hypothetical protein
VLFADSFNRSNGAINGSLTGITNNTGTDLSGGAYSFPYGDPNLLSPDGSATNGGGADITGNQLRLAVGAGTSNAIINHNFTNASMLGGFSVTIDLTAYNQTTNEQGGGFAIGMSLAEALATGDANDGLPNSTKMTEAFRTTGAVTSDFWLGLRGNNTLAWGGRGANPTVNLATVAAKTGTISAVFSPFTNFNAGTIVGYEVFYNGVSQGTGSFAWNATNSNYIGLDGRDNTAVVFDNLSITAIPEPSSALIGGLGLLALLRRRR